MICLLPDRPAALVRAATPDLPPMALYQGIYGVVRVRVELDRTGAIQNTIIGSTPSRVLVPESLRAARASTFAPARRHCAKVASVYDFRVLYAEDGPLPAPSPSPTPLPKPDLGKPWRMLLSIWGMGGFTERTLTSSGAYSQVDGSLTVPNNAECAGTLAAPVLNRVTAVLRAARPEMWRGGYRLVDDPTPAPSPAASRTPRPTVDVIAAVRDDRYSPGVADAPSGRFTLEAGAITYRVDYEVGAFPGIRETVPVEIKELARVLIAATAERCLSRTP